MRSTLTLGDGFISIAPFPETLLAKLHYWKREYVINEKTHRRAMTMTNERLYNIQTCAEADGTIVQKCFTLPGFAKRCKDHLALCRYDVTVVDSRTPMPPPDMGKAMTGLREYQYELVYNMLMSCGGILSGATGLGKTHIIKALCNAYSHEALMHRGTPTIVVAVPDKDITQKNFDDLTELLPDRDVGLIMSGRHKPSDDIQVITLDSLHKLEADDVGVLIVDEMHTAASDTRAKELLRFTKARAWGVSATPDGRFDGKDIVAEGIFGPVVATFSYADGVKSGCLVPVKVYWINCPEPNIGIENYRRYKTREQRYKWGIYNNRPLNDMIGRIYAGIPDDLQTLGMLQFTKHMEQVLRGCANACVNPMPIQCHAGTDAAEFPPTSFWHVHAISTKERKDIYARMKEGEIRKAVSTHVWKQGVNFADLRVVINLGGGGSEIVAKQVPGRASRKVDGKDCAYIIEFRHTWDTVTSPKSGRQIAGPITRDDSSRAKIYAELGFEQIDIKDERELPWMTNSNMPTP